MGSRVRGFDRGDCRWWFSDSDLRDVASMVERADRAVGRNGATPSSDEENCPDTTEDTE